MWLPRGRDFSLLSCCCPRTVHRTKCSIFAGRVASLWTRYNSSCLLHVFDSLSTEKENQAWGRGSALVTLCAVSSGPDQKHPVDTNIHRPPSIFLGTVERGTILSSHRGIELQASPFAISTRCTTSERDLLTLTYLRILRVKIRSNKKPMESSLLQRNRWVFLCILTLLPHSFILNFTPKLW